MTQTTYDVTENQLTQIYDCVNVLTNEAKDESIGNEEVIVALIDLHAELNRVTPDWWWDTRNEEFKDLRKELRSVTEIDERSDLVIEFSEDLTELLLDSELKIEP